MNSSLPRPVAHRIFMFKWFRKPSAPSRSKEGFANLVHLFAGEIANRLAEIDPTVLQTDLDDRRFLIWVASMQVILRSINDTDLNADKRSEMRSHLLEQMKAIHPGALSATMDCFNYTERFAKSDTSIEQRDLEFAIGDWVLDHCEHERLLERPQLAETLGGFLFHKFGDFRTNGLLP